MGDGDYRRVCDWCDRRLYNGSLKAVTIGGRFGWSLCRHCVGAIMDVREERLEDHA